MGGRALLFSMRLSEEEDARLKRLAHHYGLDVTGVVRMLVKRDDDAIDDARKRAAGSFAGEPASPLAKIRHTNGARR